MAAVSGAVNPSFKRILVKQMADGESLGRLTVFNHFGG